MSEFQYCLHQAVADLAVIYGPLLQNLPSAMHLMGLLLSRVFVLEVNHSSRYRLPFWPKDRQKENMPLMGSDGEEIITIC